MIVVTGAAGFIGSCLISGLSKKGYTGIIAVDDFSKTGKAGNLHGKTIEARIERKLFFEWLEQNAASVDFIFHIGARTDTTEFNMAIFDELNTGYSRKVWEMATMFNIPLVYASSAATYGMGELGYADTHDVVE
ncbi:MAG: ADP-L-glycero-D-mannoheptose-6-epimerase, partial [Bacteroidetes bacterium HGW-Bacteroidetes-9]